VVVLCELHGINGMIFIGFHGCLQGKGFMDDWRAREIMAISSLSSSNVLCRVEK
jgi:hypothetical protein